MQFCTKSRRKNLNLYNHILLLIFILHNKPAAYSEVHLWVCDDDAKPDRVHAVHPGPMLKGARGRPPLTFFRIYLIGVTMSQMRHFKVLFGADLRR